MLKKILMLILCIAVVFSTVACGNNGGQSDGGNEENPNRQITLRIESAAPLRYNYPALLNSEEEGSMLYNQALFSKKVVEGFKALYPNINLQFIEHGWGDALYQKQQLEIQAWVDGLGMSLDIMIGEPYMGFFAENGVFAELDASKFTHVIEGAYSDMKIDGKLYGVPMCTGIMGLQYNTQILAEVGIPEDEWVPQTWAELLENSKKVSEYAEKNGKEYSGIMMNNVAGMSCAFRALPFMRQAGGDIFDENGGLALNSEANKEAFTYLRSLAKYAYKEGLTTGSEDYLQSYFVTGHAAYMVEGQWSMATAPDHIKAANLPKKEANSTVNGNVYCGNVLFGITEGSKNKAAAEAFLEYLTSAEVQNWFYELDGRLPINKNVLSSAEIKEVYPNINPYIDALVAGGFEGGLSGFTTNATDIWNKWGSFFKDVLTTEKDISVLMTETHNYILDKMD
ncbi:MAG: extracellular solute-binding protein [Clostridia bacterium]|nr:extracellular solute-binding protein [Clostridia bacterium]